MNAIIERREYPRYDVNGGAKLILQKNGFVAILMIRPKFVELGHISDISMGGLSVVNPNEKINLNQSNLLSIRVPGKGMIVTSIPYEMIANYQMPCYIDNNCQKKHGLKFGKISDDQKNLLKLFIRRFAVKK